MNPGVETNFEALKKLLLDFTNPVGNPQSDGMRIGQVGEVKYSQLQLVAPFQDLELGVAKLVQEPAKNHDTLLVLGKVLDLWLLEFLVPLLLLLRDAVLAARYRGTHPLVNVLELHLAAGRAPDDVAGADATLLLHVVTHLLLIAKLCVQCLICFLLVAFPSVTSAFVEVPDSWPTSVPRTLICLKRLAIVLFRPIDIAKNDSINILELISDFVPSRVLPLSVGSLL